MASHSLNIGELHYFKINLRCYFLSQSLTKAKKMSEGSRGIGSGNEDLGNDNPAFLDDTNNGNVPSNQ